MTRAIGIQFAAGITARAAAIAGIIPAGMNVVIAAMSHVLRLLILAQETLTAENAEILLAPLLILAPLIQFAAGVMVLNAGHAEGIPVRLLILAQETLTAENAEILLAPLLILAQETLTAENAEILLAPLLILAP